MKLQLERLMHDRVKMAIIICLLILPSLDVLVIEPNRALRAIAFLIISLIISMRYCHGAFFHVQ